MKYAGGHYEGPLALPMPPTEQQEQPAERSDRQRRRRPPPSGPWSDGAPHDPPRLGAPPPLPGTSPGHSTGLGAITTGAGRSRLALDPATRHGD